MSETSIAAYRRHVARTAGASAMAVVLVAVVGPFAAHRLWLGAGFLLMITVGLAVGFHLERHLGSPSPRFLITLGAGTLLRMVVAATSAVALIERGSGAFFAYLAGMAIGYLPLQIHEVRWLGARAQTSRT